MKCGQFGHGVALEVLDSSSRAREWSSGGLGVMLERSGSCFLLISKSRRDIIIHVLEPTRGFRVIL